jgi:hypothetical protein
VFTTLHVAAQITELRKEQCLGEAFFPDFIREKWFSMALL